MKSRRYLLPIWLRHGWIGWPALVIAAFIASVYIGILVVWAANQFGAGWSPQTTSGALLLRITIYTLMIALIVGVAYLVKQRVTLKEVGLQRLLWWKDIALALAGAVVYVLLASLALQLATLIPGFQADQAQDIGVSVSNLFGVELLTVFIVLVVLTPLAEEIIFRGILFGKLRKSGVKFIPTALIVSLLFGLAHAQWNVAIDVFMLSLVMSYLRESTGTIWAGVVLHMAKNALAFAILLSASNMY